MYTNEDLQIFVDLSQTLSFSQTARNLHLSQSTVSKRIKDLETALQVILIERGQGMKSLRLIKWPEIKAPAAKSRANALLP